MPEFVLGHGDAEASNNALDSFTQGYVEAMFFTETSADSEDCADASFNELAPDTLATIKTDCADFQNTKEWRSFCEWRDNIMIDGCADDDQAGHDFWLTRNRHGAGFWDRPDNFYGPHQDKLTALSHPYGTRNLYRGDDGLLYLA